MTTRLSELNDEQFRANRFELVSRLADDLAHEIKNPLNAIVINLEVLRSRVRKADMDAALDRVDVIESEVHRLHDLVDRLLQLLRPDRDEAASLALDQVLDEIVPLIEAQTRLARNELTVAGNASAYVPVRRDILKFALLNLLAAVHARLGEGGGQLALACSTDEVNVHIAIRDVHVSPARATSDTGFADAVHIAGALLAACGGSVHGSGEGVSIVLPKAAPV